MTVIFFFKSEKNRAPHNGKSLFSNLLHTASSATALPGLGLKTEMTQSNIEQIWGNVLTYVTIYKEQLNTSTFDRKSSSGVRRLIIIKDNFLIYTPEEDFPSKALVFNYYLSSYT